MHCPKSISSISAMAGSAWFGASPQARKSGSFLVCICDRTHPRTAVQASRNSSWRKSGKPTASISTISAEQLNDALKRNAVHIADVREPHEFEVEWIPTARSSSLTRLEEEVGYIDTTEKIVTVCPSGFRGTTAASIMKRNGIDDVAVLLTGLNDWKDKGYPLEE